ncbi:MAG: Hsp70 family protein, partial [Campylobacterota bacterium]|nr:Hsp70 family protein [Campylobacterota bacterium]
IMDGKMALSSSQTTAMNMDIFSNSFLLNLSRESFNQTIYNDIRQIDKALHETFNLANISFDKIDKVFLTGGSTLVPEVKTLYEKYFTKEKIIHTDVFTSVGYGLTLFSKNYGNL